MIKITFLAGAVLALTACGGPPARSTPTSSPSANAAVSQVCPAAMAGVHDVAAAMKINMATGSARFTFTRANVVAWLGDMTSQLQGSMWVHPSGATRQLHHDLSSAMFAMPDIRDHATAAVFISDLQSVAGDCRSS